MVKPGYGKSKGASFERAICSALSLWVSNSQYEDVFWRSAMSGGRATVRRRNGVTLAAQAGDISAIKGIGEEFLNRFVVECKHYRDLDWRGAVLGRGKLIEFWIKLTGEASAYQKYPMLIAKQNQMPTMVGLNEYGINLLGLMKHCAVVTYPTIGLFIFAFDHFLANAKPVLSPHYVSPDRRPSPKRKRERRLPVRDL